MKVDADPAPLRADRRAAAARPPKRAANRRQPTPPTSPRPCRLRRATGPLSAYVGKILSDAGRRHHLPRPSRSSARGRGGGARRRGAPLGLRARDRAAPIALRDGRLLASGCESPIAAATGHPDRSGGRDGGICYSRSGCSRWWLRRPVAEERPAMPDRSAGAHDRLVCCSARRALRLRDDAAAPAPASTSCATSTRRPASATRICCPRGSGPRRCSGLFATRRRGAIYVSDFRRTRADRGAAGGAARPDADRLRSRRHAGPRRAGPRRAAAGADRRPRNTVPDIVAAARRHAAGAAGA